MKKILLILLLVLVLGTIILLMFSNNDEKYDNDQLINQEIPSDEIINTIPPQIESTIKIDTKDLQSIYILANKNNSLPQDYVPSDLIMPNVLANKNEIYLKKEAALALEEMFEAAKIEDINLILGSAYRSYDYQKNLYDNYVARDGQEAANRYSAKPGQSEHQTGLAVDISDYNQEHFLMNSFKDTKEGQWLKDNAHLYGFILRYPQDKEAITGYMFEPWHFRYVGKDVATEIYNANLVYEEYLEME